MEEDVVDRDVKEVFEKLQMPVDTSKKVGLWQVRPISKGTRLFTETH